MFANFQEAYTFSAVFTAIVELFLFNGSIKKTSSCVQKMLKTTKKPSQFVENNRWFNIKYKNKLKRPIVEKQS